MVLVPDTMLEEDVMLWEACEVIVPFAYIFESEDFLSCEVP
jgi:hypothetical protein